MTQQKRQMAKNNIISVNINKSNYIFIICIENLAVTLIKKQFQRITSTVYLSGKSNRQKHIRDAVNKIRTVAGIMCRIKLSIYIREAIHLQQLYIDTYSRLVSLNWIRNFTPQTYIMPIYRTNKQNKTLK